MEEWKDMVGYEDIYQISSLGRVKSFHHDRIHGQILRLARHRSGYLQVCLCRDGKRSYKYVHRLVAIAFLGDHPGYEINHRNGDKTDNRVENLEWVTAAQNTRHAIADLGKTRSGEDNGFSKLADEDVIEIRKLYATGRYTQAELGEMFGVDQTTISLIVNRVTWQHVP